MAKLGTGDDKLTISIDVAGTTIDLGAGNW